MRDNGVIAMDEPAQSGAAFSQTPRARRPRTKLSALLLKRALDEIYFPRPAPTIFNGGPPWNDLYPLVRETVGDQPITYLEFGVFRGNTIRRLSDLFQAKGARFFGFDSFEGLPEEWGKIKKDGFSTGGKLPKVNDSRISFVKGYFQNTVPQFVAATPLTAPVLVHFDADLYSSTLFLLTTLWHHVPEYYFMFDEFLPDEAVAMYDFALAYPVDFEFIACCAPQGDPRRPYHVFGRMKRTGYAPPPG